MHIIKQTILGGVALCGFAAATMAADYQAYPYYIGYSAKHGEPLTAEQRGALRAYAAQEEREPCQSYMDPPPGFYRDGCTLMYRVAIPAPPPPPAPAPAAMTQAPRSIQSYNLYFAFDRADISPSEMATIDRIAQEILVYEPSEVTVAGHTDTAGPADYNYALSERRAAAVSAALTARGISHSVIDSRAYGQSRLAVPTPDNVKLQENRRVEVEFLK